MILKTEEDEKFKGVEPILEIDQMCEDKLFSQFEIEPEINDDFYPGLGDFKFTYGITEYGVPLTLYKHLEGLPESRNLIVLAHVDTDINKVIKTLGIPDQSVVWIRPKN